MLTRARCILALFFLTFLVYTNTLGGSYVYNDEAIYFDDPSLAHRTVVSAFTEKASFFHHSLGYDYYRPVAVLFHAWMYQLFGLNPFVLHLVSVMLHAAASILCFLLLMEAGVAETSGAFAIAALFVVHPLHVESVAWMAAAADVLGAVFVLGSLYTLCLARRRRSLLAVSCLLALLAFGTKESSLVLPALALLFVGMRAWPLFIAAGGWSVLRVLVPGFARPRLQSRPLFDQAMVLIDSTAHYAKQMIWPWPLAVEYDEVQTWAARIVFLAICVAIAWWCVRHIRARQGALWFVFTLAPGLGAALVLQELNRVQDRYTYLAILGFLLPFAAAVRYRAGRCAVAALVVLWSALSVTATFHWYDTESLWTQTLRVTPTSKNAVLGLGEWYFLTGEPEKAERIYNQGLAIHPGDRELLSSREALRGVLKKR